MGPTTWYLDLLLGVLTLAGFMDRLGGARRAEKLRELRRCVQEAVGFKKPNIQNTTRRYAIVFDHI